MKKKEVEEMYHNCLLWTTWPDGNVQPPDSFFHPDQRDLKIIKRYGHSTLGNKLIAVYHKHCSGYVSFSAHPTDPIFSRYVCESFSGIYGFCGKTWDLACIQNMKHDEFKDTFYTKLLEKEEDLKSWPEKLAEADCGKNRYTTLRAVTREELIRARMKRIIDIREAA